MKWFLEASRFVFLAIGAIVGCYTLAIWRLMTMGILILLTGIATIFFWAFCKGKMVLHSPNWDDWVRK